MLTTSFSDTIAAVSTPAGTGGIAVLRVSGANAIEYVLRVISAWHPDGSSYPDTHFCRIPDLDDVVVTLFKAPHSFTGEDVAEIQCHGSKAVLNSVFKTLSSFNDVRLAEPGEFSKRAFYNNKMDLTEAEGLADLIDAETSEQQKYAIKQMEGNLKNLYYSWRENLLKVLSYLEAFIDFPEEDIPQNLQNEILNTVFKTKEEIKNHLSGNNVNERLKNGFRITITGAVNAGKSSLINALTQKNTMIVSDIEGTTRDAVDINLDIKGYPVVITDTAGIHQTEDKIEKIGIETALQRVKEADIVLALYDASVGSFDDSQLPENINNIIYVANKADKLNEKQIKDIEKKNHCMISAKYKRGIDNLIDRITDILKNNFSSSSSFLITRTRYREALEECLNNLEIFSLNKEIELSAEDIRMACRAIGTITGNIKVDEILDNIFGSFCIGK